MNPFDLVGDLIHAAILQFVIYYVAVIAVAAIATWALMRFRRGRHRV